MRRKVAYRPYLVAAVKKIRHVFRANLRDALAACIAQDILLIFRMECADQRDFVLGGKARGFQARRAGAVGMYNVKLHHIHARDIMAVQLGDAGAVLR